MGSVGNSTNSTGTNVQYPTEFGYGSGLYNADFIPVDELYPNEWKNAKDDYAEYLASSFYASREGYEGPDHELYVLENDKGDRAFIHIDEGTGHLDALGSTGGGMGTEALIRTMEVMAGKGKGLYWSTDNPDSSNYYDHLGLSKYGKDNGWIKGSKNYDIPKEELPKVIAKLRKKYKRNY